MLYNRFHLKVFVSFTLIMGLTAATGCSLSPEIDTTKVTPKGSVSLGSESVTVVRKTITSVVAITSIVEANPTFYISSPVEGVVHLIDIPDAATAQTSGTIIAKVGASDVALSHPGLVVDHLVQEGQYVAQGIPLMRVKYAGFGIPIRVAAEQMFRLYTEPVSALANVTAGPSGVACALVASAQEEGAVSTENSAGTASVCLLPMDTRVVSGLSARVGLNTATKENVLTVPVGAVSGSAQTGSVSLLTEENAVTTAVTLGITDGINIEIVEGLAEGDTVLAQAPWLGR